jgi:hypothetical protein
LEGLAKLDGVNAGVKDKSIVENTLRKPDECLAAPCRHGKALWLGRGEFEQRRRCWKQMGDGIVRLWKLFPSCMDETTSDSTGPFDGDLLSYDRPYCKFKTIYRTWDAQPWVLSDEWTKCVLVVECVVNGDRIGIEIEQLTTAIDCHVEVA